MAEDDPRRLQARILRCSEEEYHADPCDAPALSATMAGILLDQSPLHAWAHHPKLGNLVRREPTKALDRGTLIHKLVLGAGAELVVVAAADWRTKAAREQRDEARAAGQLPVLEHELDDARAAADAITARLADEGVVLDGVSEVTLVWQELTVHGAIWARGRFDHLREDTGVILDLKTARNAHPEKCGRCAVDYGYATQGAAYTSGLRRLRPDLAGRIVFELIFVEPTPPYAVTIGSLDGVLRRYGETRWERAVQTWGSCLHGNRWPGYGRVNRIEAPFWLASRMMEEA